MTFEPPPMERVLHPLPRIREQNESLLGETEWITWGVTQGWSWRGPLWSPTFQAEVYAVAGVQSLVLPCICWWPWSLFIWVLQKMASSPALLSLILTMDSYFKKKSQMPKCGSREFKENIFLKCHDIPQNKPLRRGLGWQENLIHGEGYDI